MRIKIKVSLDDTEIGDVAWHPDGSTFIWDGIEWKLLNPR